MKILLVAHDFYGVAGGAEFCLQTFTKLLVANGHRCMLLTGRYNKKYLNSKIPALLTIVPVSEKQLVDTALRTIKTFQPDFIVGQKNWGADIIKSVCKQDVPTLFFLRSTNYLTHQGERNFLKHYWVDIYNTNSNYDRKILKQKLGINSIMSYPLVDLDTYKVRIKHPTYISMINYRPEKGKEIFNAVASRLPKEKFMAVRSWIPIKQHKSIRHNNMTITGPYWDMKYVYARTKILLIPSLWPEPYGRIALEAGINGIPVIASNIAGIPEAVANGGTLIDKYQDVNEWVNEIQKLKNKQYYRLMSLRMLERVLQYSCADEFRKIERAMLRELSVRRTFNKRAYRYLVRLVLRIKRFCYYRFGTQPKKEKLYFT